MAQQIATLWSKKLKPTQIWSGPETGMPKYYEHNPQPAWNVNHDHPHSRPSVDQPWQFFPSDSAWTHPPGPVLPRCVARTRRQGQEKPHLPLWTSNFISWLRAATLSWLTWFFLIYATTPASELIPEKNPLLSQCGQAAPLSYEHLHQVGGEPLTPLNVAHTHLLARGEKKHTEGAAGKHSPPCRSLQRTVSPNTLWGKSPLLR